ncbi:Mitogen-activated protein kinase kinase kinase 1 [Vitis vinifera]|uniref:Mitogen-activated protein kinase kinase kinase 1 n=1 Tax=Vitis vinifera TaxID=29760 RepID=A0A438GTT5_VITVI|nr:Mitogen-activated protein kinase kinase kinase 1 [Vitis vinifera]
MPQTKIVSSIKLLNLKFLREKKSDGDGRFFAVKEVLLTDQGRAGPGSKALINFNRLCSQKQFHIDPGCILEGSFLISFIMVQEISLLSQFQHKHIVQYYGSFKDKTKLYIFLELATEGSLLNLYQEHKLSDSQASKYTRQIVKGISGGCKWNRETCGFWIGKALQIERQSFKGTAFWMALRSVDLNQFLVINEDKRENDGYGFAADTWSLGNIHIPNWSRVVWVENGIKMSLGLSMEQIAVGFEG